jgi:hypothetical protein
MECIIFYWSSDISEALYASVYKWYDMHWVLQGHDPLNYVELHEE